MNSIYLTIDTKESREVTLSGTNINRDSFSDGTYLFHVIFFVQC